MQSPSILSIGDRVLWRGSWGADAPREATVTAIDVAGPGQSGKYGDPVPFVEWSLIEDPRSPRRVVVSLSTGHWAYGFQLGRAPAAEVI